MGLIRFLLALAVLLEHANISPRPLYGPLAVQAFYMISGFYIQMILAERYFAQGGGWAPVKRFYASRCLRIFPAYWLCLMLTAALLLLHGGARGQLIAEGAFGQGFGVALAYVVSQVTLIGNEVLTKFLSYDPAAGHFVWTYAAHAEGVVRASEFTVVPQSWSISLELMFYALAPLLLRFSSWGLGAVFLASVAVRLLLAEQGYTTQDWLNGFFPSELALFLIGAVAFRFYRARVKERQQKGRAGWVFLALIICYSAAYWRLPGSEEASVKYWLFLSVLAAGLPYVFHLTRDWKRDRWIGELSYPLYLVHFIAIAGVQAMAGGGGWTPYVTVALTLVMAVLAARLVDAPMDRYRHRKFRA